MTMSKTFRDRMLERQEAKHWKYSLRGDLGKRVWFKCDYCNITYSGKPERKMNKHLVCPLCGDGIMDSDRIR
jgi:PHP family Zn ribbon phosphoesterase